MPKLKSKSKRRKSKKSTDTETSALSLKEQLAQQRRAQKEKQKLIQFATTTFSVGSLLGLLLGLIAEPEIGVAAAVGVTSLALAYKYPRKALWVFLIYMPFGGTITYAIGNSALLQLAKDGLYIPALISIFQECRQKKLPFIIPKALRPSLLILLGTCLLTILVVNGSQQLQPLCSELPRGGKGLKCISDIDSPILMGILGLKIFMGYVPLIFCTYYLIRSQKELLFISRLHTVLAIVCCALCLVQYTMLLTGICEGTSSAEGADLFKASIGARCLVGGSLLYSPSQGVVRLPGTFVAPWQWGWFLISSAFLTFATAFGDPKPLWRIVGLIGMAFVFICAVISGQRIALALVPLVTVVLLILTGQITNLKRFIPIGLGLVILLGTLATTYPDIVQERIDSFVSRWEASPATEFITEQFAFTWKNLDGSLLGLGLGRATNSARVFGDTSLIETWFPKVMHEVGPVGLIAFLGLVTSITVLTFKAYRSVRDKNLRTMGASYWVFILFISYQTYYYPLDVDPVAVYYWLLAGVILKMPEIDWQEQEKKLAAEENEPQSKKKRGKKASGRRKSAKKSKRRTVAKTNAY
ncbi:MAG: hormogonium polysaccharide biosynthesis protein HpsL [Coleofasciculaceae cyanobacterium]